MGSGCEAEGVSGAWGAGRSSCLHSEWGLRHRSAVNRPQQRAAGLAGLAHGHNSEVQASEIRDLDFLCVPCC